MIKKNVIREDGFNLAIIEKVYQNGDAVGTLQQIELDENGSEVVLKEDINIIFSGGSLDFSEEELSILNPQPTEEQQVV